jgi:hypothetical protein
MTYRNKFILSAASLGALVLLFLSSLVFSPENSQKRSAKGSLVLASKKNSVAEIRIAAEGKTLSLRKSQSEWFLSEGDSLSAQESYPAQKARVEDFIDVVFATTELYPVTAKKDSWAKFELEDGKAKKVSIVDESGKTVGEFLVGKYDPSGASIYLRKAEGDTVYSASRGFVSFVTTDAKYWSYLRLFPDTLKEQDVVSVSVKSNLVLGKENGKELLDDYEVQADRKAGWVVKGDEARKLNPDAVSSMIRSLISLEAEGYAKPDGSGLDTPSIKVKLASGKGTDYTFLVGKEKEEGKFFATIEGAKYTYLVSKWTLESAIRNLEEIESKEDKK